MNVGVEALFTSALGLHPPSVVEDVKLDVLSTRIDFEDSCSGALLNWPVCNSAGMTAITWVIGVFFVSWLIYATIESKKKEQKKCAKRARSRSRS